MNNEHGLFHSIHQLSRQLTRKINEALQPYGLYSSQWSVIYVLKSKGTLTQTELCDYLSVEAPPMTRMIQRLVKQGLVKQTVGNDKRIKRIQLTDQALSEYPLWESVVLETNQELLSQFPEHSQEGLYRLISEWLIHIKSGM